MNADGSDLTLLTNNSADDEDPAWSPDGRRIAFASVKNWDYHIFVINADGSGGTSFTDRLADHTSPAWSPDGRKIAFTSNRDAGDNDIYVMNAGSPGVNADKSGERGSLPMPTPTLTTASASVHTSTPGAGSACQPGMTLQEGEHCTVAIPTIDVTTDRFEVREGSGCYGNYCAGRSTILFNLGGFNAIRDPDGSWTIQKLP